MKTVYTAMQEQNREERLQALEWLGLSPEDAEDMADKMERNFGLRDEQEAV